MDEQTKAYLERHDRRFDEIDRRFTAVDARLDGIDARLAAHDERFDRIEARLDEHSRQFVELRRHFGVFAEDLIHRIQLVAEGHAVLERRIRAHRRASRREFQELRGLIVHALAARQGDPSHRQ